MVLISPKFHFFKTIPFKRLAVSAFNFCLLQVRLYIYIQYFFACSVIYCNQLYSSATMEKHSENSSVCPWDTVPIKVRLYVNAYYYFYGHYLKSKLMSNHTMWSQSTGMDNANAIQRPEKWYDSAYNKLVSKRKFQLIKQLTYDLCLKTVKPCSEGFPHQTAT